jgi:hypothetical protein
VKSLPFEFVEFTQEISRNVLSEHGKNRVVILCDEANLLPDFFQEEILSRYFELFCPQQFQFVFVAGFLPWHDRIMPDCFETSIELGGFGTISDFAEFIRGVNTSDINVSDDALDALFTEFKGHPRHSLGVCWRAYETVSKKGGVEIDRQMMEAASQEYRRLLASQEREFRGAYKRIQRTPLRSVADASREPDAYEDPNDENGGVVT